MQRAIQYMAFCETCQRNTVHWQNVNQINWGMHFALAVVTCGVWLIAPLIESFFSKPGAPVCSVCGNVVIVKPPPFWKSLWEAAWHTLMWLAIILGGAFVAAWVFQKFGK